MKDTLTEKYKKYANSEESYAVLFVKKYLKAAANKWIDIIDWEVGRYNDVKALEFQEVTCELFEKKIIPQYPSKNSFAYERDYILTCRAITWETAHRDIDEQRLKNITGPIYSLRGIRIRIKNPQHTGEFFVPNAPDEIKALAKNLNDRTDPLWDIAVKYISHDEKYFYEYKLVDVKRRK